MPWKKKMHRNVHQNNYNVFTINNSNKTTTTNTKKTGEMNPTKDFVKTSANTFNLQKTAAATTNEIQINNIQTCIGGACQDFRHTPTTTFTTTTTSATATTTATNTHKKSKLNNSILKCYLVTYNLLNSLGWSYVMLHLLSNLFTNGWTSLTQSWTNLSTIVWFLQILVLLDILHAIAGFWGPHPTLPLHRRIWCKVGHRSEIFVTIYFVENSGKRMTTMMMMGEEKDIASIFYAFMIFTWALADIFRFLYYAASVVGVKLQWLSWIRYSMFLVQWPLNVIAEGLFVGYLAVWYLFQEEHCCLFGLCPWLSYGWIALFFQVRNCVEFLPGMRKLYEARCLRLYNAGGRRRGR